MKPSKFPPVAPHSSGHIATARSRRKRLSLILLSVLMSACAVGPDFSRPAAPDVPGYLATAETPAAYSGDGMTQEFSADASLPTDWWQLFASPVLNQMVEKALEQNPGLQASAATLRQNQNNLSAAYGVFFPQLDLSLSGKRQRTAPVQNGSDAVPGIFNFVSLGSSISYALDLSGGARRAVEGMQAATDYQRHLNRAAYLMLSANVVNTAIAYAAYGQQLQLMRELIVLQQAQLQLARHQYQAGLLPYSAVLSVQSQLDADQASLAPLELRKAQAEHLLASLSGQPAGTYAVPELRFSDIHLPLQLPLSLPSELVRQRPDILSSEAQLHIASANIGVATAALFPGISLTANFGTAASTWGNLSGDGQRFWSIGPTLDLPLLKGNNAWYARKAAIDAFEAAQLNYRQTVLNAFAQVADTLKALQADAQTVQAKAEASQSASEAVRLMRVNYRAGVAAYSDELAASVQQKLAQIDHLQALAQRQQDTVALFVALGGGWWNAAPLSGGAS